MVAYVVFTREKMRNRDEYEQYREKSRPVNASHPLKPLALYGKYEVLEGPAIEGAVILEFPTIEAAKTYYNSPAYQEPSSIVSLLPTIGCSSLRGFDADASARPRDELGQSEIQIRTEGPELGQHLAPGVLDELRKVSPRLHG